MTPGCFSPEVSPVRDTQLSPGPGPVGGNAALAVFCWERLGLQAQELVRVGVRLPPVVLSLLLGHCTHSVRLVCGVGWGRSCAGRRLSLRLVSALRAAWSSA